MSVPRDSPLSASELRLLLVGKNEKDFFSLRDVLAQTADQHIHLEFARSYVEAMARITAASCDIVLCDYTPGDGLALSLLQQIRQTREDLPVVFLSDHIDEATVATAIQNGACACIPASSLGESRTLQAVWYAIDIYCKERRRQRSEDMLRKLWRAVEQSADLIVITDRAGVIEYVNPAFEDLTGYPRHEAVGQTLRLLKSDQQAPELFDEMWRTLLAGQVFRGAVANRKKNGELFIVEKTITPLRDSEGAITHFISNDRDITERRRLESDLQQSQKMDAIGRLAGGVAHDFNNLLMVISAYAELMLDSFPTEHPLRHNVEQIITAAGRAADLTRQLLAFGRKQMQSLQLLDLNIIVRDISRMLPRLIGEDIQLLVVPSPRTVLVKSDPVQIEQVVMNLAANARDAMPQGGTLTIETARTCLDEPYVQRHTMVPPGDYALLQVSDTGHGISSEHLAHIFEPFYTTKAEGKGTGLGLATTYGIVKQNGGFIWVYSEPGLGTTFKIYLPQAAEIAREAVAAPAIEKSPHGSETLLLVEDETAVRESAHEFLRLSGYTVLQAANGNDALRAARAHSGTIHLMITDVVMPNMGGANLAEQLQRERPDMKVLFVSGYAENTVLRHGNIDVANRFLQKPFTLKSLARKVWEVLQTSELSSAAATFSSR